MRKFTFGELEFSILKLVRELRKATVREVYETMGNPGSYTTIMTVMGRMAHKGELKREKNGAQYVYWASDELNPPANTLLKRIQNKLFGGQPVAMVSYLLETEESVTEDDLKEIEKIIAKRRAGKKIHG